MSYIVFSRNTVNSSWFVLAHFYVVLPVFFLRLLCFSGKNVCSLLFVNITTDSHKSSFPCISTEMRITFLQTEEEAGNVTEITMKISGSISIFQQSQT